MGYAIIQCSGGIRMGYTVRTQLRDKPSELKWMFTEQRLSEKQETKLKSG